MSGMKAYLAEKYMSGPKADAILSRVAPTVTKKKKRKAATATTSGSNAPSSSAGAWLKDEDGGWGDENKEEEDDVMADAVVAQDRNFKKRKVVASSAQEGDEEGSGWATVREGVSTTAQREETPPPADEQPMIVDATPFVGGLVTAAQLRKVMPQNDIEVKASAEEIARAQETVYRDSTGKKIDTKAARAEAARLKREREEKEAQKMEWGKGLVQKVEAEKMRRELEKQKTRGFARYADDKDLNEELKAKELWNDPAAAFLTKTKQKGPRKPEYNGPPPPPNRFGIKPGYRWDGVDRGNGFEKKLFQSKNDKRRRGLESYQWSVDDM